MIERVFKPETLPPAEDVKKVGRKLTAESKKQLKGKKQDRK